MKARTDWALLGEAVDFYGRRGYSYVEAPWATEDRFCAMTAPNSAWRSQVDGLGTLVGSAEQSFLQETILKRLAPGRYCAVTPCFRVGEALDDIHAKTFMKLELFDSEHASDGTVDQMIDDAESFFTRALRDRAPWLASKLRWQKTDQGTDLEVAGIEVGSYGRRSTPELSWAYGTGVAEPRFSSVIALNPATPVAAHAYGEPIAYRTGTRP